MRAAHSRDGHRACGPVPGDGHHAQRAGWRNGDAHRRCAMCRTPMIGINRSSARSEDVVLEEARVDGGAPPSLHLLVDGLASASLPLQHVSDTPLVVCAERRTAPVEARHECAHQGIAPSPSSGWRSSRSSATTSMDVGMQLVPPNVEGQRRHADQVLGTRGRSAGPRGLVGGPTCSPGSPTTSHTNEHSFAPSEMRRPGPPREKAIRSGR